MKAQSRLVPPRVRALARAAAAVAAVVYVPLVPASSAFADAGAAAHPPGAVVGVSGAPFLWVADEQGVLHLVGDTPALDGHTVDWSNAAQLSLDQLRSAALGDPWLSAGLVKIGDAIYLPRRSGNTNAPTLYHVQSPADLTLIGLNGQNYGQLVRDVAAWEQQYGFSTGSLLRAELASVVPSVPVATPPSPTTPAAPAAPAGPGPAAAPSTAAAAYAASGLLSHVPRFGSGGDVGFDVPSGHNWNDATGINNLDDFLPLGTLTGEQTIARWWGFNGTGRVYTFLQVNAIHLATHPDVKTVQDLSTLKMRFVCRDVTSCSLAVQQDATLGAAPGVPAAIVDSTMDRQLGELKQLSGVTTDQSDRGADRLTWKMRDVFVVKGNYGYDIRLAQTDSELSTDRLADLDQMLASLTFRY